MAEIKKLPTLEVQERIAEALESMAEGSSGGGLIKVSYSELVNLKSNAELVPGAFYRITDYETTTTQLNTRSAGHLFDVVIQALSESELAEVGTAIEREGENYFANAGAKLGAWQIWYDINNDTERYEWADEVSGKGVIYRMIDENMNDLPYDFKNIQFKRKFDSSGAEFVDRWSLNGSGVDRYLYTFNVIDENDDDNDCSTKQIYISDEGIIMKTYNNKFSSYSAVNSDLSIAIQSLLDSVLIYDYDLYGYFEFYGFNNNTIGNGFNNNTIGNYFSSNTIGNNFNNNTIGNDFSSNTIGNDFNYNTIGNGFYNNTIGNNFNNNTIGNNFNYNTIGNGFNNNTIGNYFSSNTIGNYFSSNTIGNYFNYNTIGNYFNYNTIGNGFNYNTIGNGFYNNTIGAYYRYCQFGEGVQYIKLEQAGINSSQYQNITVKAGVVGASHNNPLVIEDEASLRNKAYNIEISRSQSGRVLMLWYDDNAVKIGKYKATITSATWADL